MVIHFRIAQQHPDFAFFFMFEAFLFAPSFDAALMAVSSTFVTVDAVPIAADAVPVTAPDAAVPTLLSAPGAASLIALDVTPKLVVVGVTMPVDMLGM